MGVLEKKACSKIQVESNEARSIKLKENNMKGKSAVLTPTEVIDIDAEENENATSVFERSDQYRNKRVKIYCLSFRRNSVDSPSRFSLCYLYSVLNTV